MTRKFEKLKSKLETNPKSECFNIQNERCWNRDWPEKLIFFVYYFCHLIFEFVSAYFIKSGDIRISNLHCDTAREIGYED